MSAKAAVTERPAGLEYREEFVTPAEERSLLGFFEAAGFRELVMRGQTAKRTVLFYGFDYDYDSYGKLVPGEPLPLELTWLRDRCAALAGVPSEALAQTLVQRYPPGAPIGWHRDAPMFGLVVGVSLVSACRLRFQRGSADARETFEIELAPRSAYVLDGDARSSWQHSIPPVKELRYSVTFRTLKNPARWQR